MKNCISALLLNNIVPIINENDVVSVTELMFTDNDELAGLLSSMINAEMLILLTSVDGVYDGDPESSQSTLIHNYDPLTIDREKIKNNNSTTGFGRGGIVSKCDTAIKTAALGIPVTIANGRHVDVIEKIVNGDKIGTHFAAKKTRSNIKKYIAHAIEQPKGKLVINQGAKRALTSSNANSLLPVGINEIIGDFETGDMLRIVDENNKELGLGLAKCGHQQARDTMGLQNQMPVVHYDHLYLHEFPF